MIRMQFLEAATLLNLPPLPIQGEFTGLTTDSRAIQAGNVFVAIPGERVDGHDFIEEARVKGAVLALVTRKVASPLPQLLVPDINVALGQLAAAWRKQFTIPFLAVTGSSGKTTLKNMIANILIAACKQDKTQVLATASSFNNHLGLPLTLARLNTAHRYAVIEMGMNHFGEISYLSKLTQPDVAAITNAAAAHLAGVGGTLAGVAKAKGEIFEGLSETGTAILNRDDTFFDYWTTLTSPRNLITFGFHPDAMVTTTDYQVTPYPIFTLQTPKGICSIELPLLGKHNMINALAAAAAVLPLGISLEAIKQGLEQTAPAPHRMQKHSLPNGVTLIDDTYNANPFSLDAAVETLTHFPDKKIVILGGMRELGEEAAAWHSQAGERIRKAGIDHLFTYGEHAHHAAEQFGKSALHFDNHLQLAEAVLPLLQSPAAVLIKGSRAMKMEEVVNQLLGEEQACHDH